MQDEDPLIDTRDLLQFARQYSDLAFSLAEAEVSARDLLKRLIRAHLSGANSLQSMHLECEDGVIMQVIVTQLSDRRLGFVGQCVDADIEITNHEDYRRACERIGQLENDRPGALRDLKLKTLRDAVRDYEPRQTVARFG